MENIVDETEIVCILGMHRSGTSLVARALNLLGLYLGPKKKILKAASDNPKGFWEHKEITSLNEEILETFGGSWHDPPILPPGWESDPHIEDLRQRARELIERDFAGKSLWGWKDPRNCLTLPFWQLLFPRMRLVVCLRNPIDVALSLRNRHSFSLEKGIDLWLNYMNSALRSMTGQYQLQVFYEDFMSDWSRELRRLAAFLEMPERAVRPSVLSRVQDFIQKDLQHHSTSIDETLEESAVGFPAKALYLVERVRNGFGKRSGYNDECIERALEIFSRRAVEAQNELRTQRERLAEQGQVLAEKANRIQVLESQSELYWKNSVEQIESMRHLWGVLPSGGDLIFSQLAERFSQPAEKETLLQLFWFEDNGFSQAHSVKEGIVTGSQLHQYSIQLPPTACGPFRLDPGDQASYVEIHHIALYAGNPETQEDAQALALWSVENSFASVLPVTGIVPLKGQDCFRFICTDKDPQLFLGGIPDREDDKPWVLRLTMSVSTDFQQVISLEGFLLQQELMRKEEQLGQRADELGRQAAEALSIRTHLENSMQVLSSQLSEKERVSQALQTQLVQREQDLQLLESQHKSEQQRLLQQLAEREQALQSLQTQIADERLSVESREAQFKTEQEGLVQQIQEKGIAVETLQGQLNEQEEVLRSLKAQFKVEQEGLVQQIQEKGIAVETLQVQLIEQEEAVQSLEAQLRAQLVRQEESLQSIEAEHRSERQQLMQQLAQREMATLSLSVQLQAQGDELNRITDTLGWRLLSHYGPIKYRFVLPAYSRIRKLFRSNPRSKTDQISSNADQTGSNAGREAPYESWARLCGEFRYNREKVLSNIEQFRYKPVISILMPVYNTPIPFLRQAIDSVLSQYYPHWELCICDDASTVENVRQVLEEYAAADRRIRVAFSQKNNGIAIASNRALELATGEFIGLLDHDDELTPDSLYEVVSTLQTVDADLIYSDEDKRDLEGRRCEPFFKPAWSPDLLFSYMYLCHFSVYRKSVVDRLGGFREGFDGSQDYDLALRVTETTNKIAHIPKILYHWRKVPASTAARVTAKPQAFVAAQKALADALHRRNIAGKVEINTEYGYYRIKREIVTPGKVTIIIPTRDRLDLLRRCIDSIESATDYKNYEIVIVDNGSEESETLHYFKHTPHRVIRDEGEFNFSRLNNLAAQQADGEYLLLLNNDTEVIAGEWLSAMVEHAQRPEVGAVGAKLLYPDGRIQHAGVVIGLGGVAGHSHKFVDGFRGTGYAHFPNLIRNYGAVTAACLMIRREVFNEMGGLNEQELAVAFNDVDLCLRLRKRGYLIVYTPYALLYHHESASRGYELNRKEVSYMRARWHQELMSDPYYNPNLSLLSENFAMDYSKPEWSYCVYSHILADGVVENLHRGRSVGQEFFTSENKISAVAVRFGTHFSQVKGTVRFHLRESHRAEQDLAVVEADASLIIDNEYHLFLFDAITRSGGRRYYFYVEFIEASSNETLTIWKSTITSKEAGPHFENHRPMQGTLSFKVFCDKQFFRYNSGSDLLCLIAERT